LRLTARRTIAVSIVALVFAGCGVGPVPSGSPLASANGTDSLPVAGSPSATPSARAGSPDASGLTVEVDPGLLDVLPGQVDGLSLTYDAENTARVAADPTLAPQASALAMAIAVAPGASGSTDLAVVSVVHVRDPSVGDEWFRQWRDSYDQSACESAGGVSGHAQASIAGRTVFIGSCAGGAFTYHVRLADGSIVVSALSVGPRRLGEKVMEGIKP
jgi:hypothetical protein